MQEMLTVNADRFPVDLLVADLRKALAENGAAVVHAPPGAGKSTRVPLWLLEQPWLAGRKIVMLEPRRIAARSVAAWMARTLNEPVGETVGYRIRMDSKVGPKTRIEVVTEGVLTRMLQDNPELPDVGLVIFDEFHERSLNSDLGLSLCLDVRASLRDDLRLLVMSATLDAGPVAKFLGGAPLLRCDGKAFPVETLYVPASRSKLEADAVVDAVRSAVNEHDGDVLVFLPGAADIRRVDERLRGTSLPSRVTLFPFFGNLSQEDQERAMAPAPPGERKVVLATSIAETSITIQGIRVVVDSGWMRLPQYSPATGMTGLQTVHVSKASADQRRGRAGRTGPGVCYRMWSADETARLRAFSPPEIELVDLAPLLLELATWGVRNPYDLPWLTAPPQHPVAEASRLLRGLHAIDAEGHITRHGRELVRLPMHPRLAHMIQAAESNAARALACDIAALLSERDLLSFSGRYRPCDFRLRLDAVSQRRTAGLAGATVRRGTLRRVRDLSRDLHRRAGCSKTTASPAEHAGNLLALAYPDRVAKKRASGEGRFLLANGRGAKILGHDSLRDAEYLVVCEVDDKEREAVIAQAAPIEEATLRRMFADDLQEEERMEWNSREREVLARRQTCFGALVLDDAPIPDPDPGKIAQAMAAGIRELGLESLPWTKETRAWRARLSFLHRLDPERWPDTGDDALLADLNTWLVPFLSGIRRSQDLKKVDLNAALHAMLSWDDQQAFEELAPARLQVPSGAQIRLDYEQGESPILPVQIQKMFGARQTPRIARGRVPVIIQLLSPAQRPVQTTDDLASFWANTYEYVRKELRGRYPKHSWPQDPLTAVPTNRTKCK